MRLYLVQHGKAASEEADPQRALTEGGVCEVTWVAERLKGRLAGISEVLHSGKARARQTAELLAPQLAPNAPVRETEGIAPKSDAIPWAKSLKNREDDLMLVSHLPFVSRLASLLLTGDEGAETISFRNAGVACLERDDSGRWRVVWILTPELCRPRED